MELQETSRNFEVEELPDFLSRVTTLVNSGFDESEIHQVQTVAESMQIDSSKQLDFPIDFKGVSTSLKITLFMDEFEIPEVKFLTHPDLAGAIDREMNAFFQK
jgi:hypothetical protein